MNAAVKAKFATYAGRVLLTLALLALLGAWAAQLSGGPLIGMSQEHLFADAITFALLGIGSFLDAIYHVNSTS